MKKILLLFMMCALLPMTAGATVTPTDDTFTVSDLEQDEENDYFFTVSLNGSQIYTAFNLDLYLPSGITVMGDGNEYYIYITKDENIYPTSGKGSNKTFKHQIAYNVTEQEHHIRLTCASTENAEFKTTEGDMFIVYVNIDNTALAASFSPKPIVKVSGMCLVKKDESQYIPADFSCRPFTTGIPTTRTLPVNISSTNKIGTLILPFATTLPSGLKAYSCNSLEGDKLTLTAAASIEACTPYIVYAENGYSGSLTGTANLTDDSNVDDVFTDGYLTGVLTNTIVNTGYILQNKGAGPMFYDAEGINFNLPAGRCYLTPTTPSSVKSFAFNFDTPTNLEEQLSNCKLSNGQMFDLSGRKVSSLARGIYIQGTRKVVVK